MPAADLLHLVAQESSTLHASDRDSHSVCLDLISVPVELRGRGCARALLTIAVTWADQTGTEIVLAATSALGSDVRRLIGLYSDYGFVPRALNATTGDVTMRREPASAVRAEAA